MLFTAATLDDKYTLETGRVYLSGVQALVRLLIIQAWRDRAAGRNTAALVSGYRGSPLGGLDQQLWRAQKYLDPLNIHVRTAVNEDLGATALWGSQQVNLFQGAKYDGVFGMWYGKGPGADRSGDVFKHANSAGTSQLGGVLAVAGDDPGCKSSTLPSQSEYAFMDALMPVLAPASVQDVLDLGIAGWELSRYSGCWVGLKMTAENADASASVHVDPQRHDIKIPTDFELPTDGLHIRLGEHPLEQERRQHQYRLYAALAFGRANKLNRTVVDTPKPRFGIAASGKAYLDVRQALKDLGIDEQIAANIGLRLYKVGMVWPLEREGVREFARGLEEVLVVEEKRAVVENQLKEQLYNWDANVRPRVVGKFDEHGDWILPSSGELTPARIARVIAKRIAPFYTSSVIDARLEFIAAKEAALEATPAKLTRMPYFCSGCPHNTSTKVPEGSQAMAGIGCHYMALWMDRETYTYTHMGGEGASWVGQAPFTETEHVFQNIGDGTYFHSGTLAIRQAVAAGVNITYKILYNDAVAMTGGQPVDGQLSVAQITHQLYGEGIRRIAVVSDEPGKYTNMATFARGVTIHERHEMDVLQRELREVKGVSALIYDQMCAAEKRRRRKRGKLEDPAKWAFINQSVCEGCGDCSVVSNCLSVIPVDTPLGRKRMINQSACNKDYSCVDGFCPSFVTVHGGQRRRRTAAAVDPPTAPPPQIREVPRTYGILVTGIGGTGVVSIGALLGMAAHLEDKGCSVLDQTGLAQKFGAVTSHVRLTADPENIHAVRIPAGEADLLLGCDQVVAASYDALAKLDTQRSAAVINAHRDMPAAFTANPDLPFPAADMQAAITSSTMPGHAFVVDATRIATTLLGDTIASNLFLLGYAFQKGLVPLGANAIERAIELNGVAVEMNRKAFAWGRAAANDPDMVANVVGDDAPRSVQPSSLDELIEHRAEYLTDYQNSALAAQYRDRVARVREKEQESGVGCTALTEAVAQNYFKVLAIKDEYEVARLFTNGEFERQLDAEFEGNYKLHFHMSPPLLARRDPFSGRPGKYEFGPWLLSGLRVLAKLRRLRGSVFDLFRFSKDRRLDHLEQVEYEQVLETILEHMTPANHAAAVELARLAASVRGFGPVKEANRNNVAARRAELMGKLTG